MLAYYIKIKLCERTRMEIRIQREKWSNVKCYQLEVDVMFLKE